MSEKISLDSSDVMDKNSIFHLKRGRGEKVIVSSWSAYQSKTPRL